MEFVKIKESYIRKTMIREISPIKKAVDGFFFTIHFNNDDASSFSFDLEMTTEQERNNLLKEMGIEL